MASPRRLTAQQQEGLPPLERRSNRIFRYRNTPARRTGLQAASLYAARKWLNKARPQTATAPVSVAEVRMAGASPAETCVLHLAPGIRLQLSVLPSPQWLAAVCAQWSPRS